MSEAAPMLRALLDEPEDLGNPRQRWRAANGEEDLRRQIPKLLAKPSPSTREVFADYRRQVEDMVASFHRLSAVLDQRKS
jgi:hypothetical protein